MDDAFIVCPKCTEQCVGEHPEGVIGPIDLANISMPLFFQGFNYEVD